MTALPEGAAQVLADPGLAGTVVIVTGAGSGVGAARARVVLAGRRIPPDGGQVTDRE
jgi:hypothetical protein